MIKRIIKNKYKILAVAITTSVSIIGAYCFYFTANCSLYETLVFDGYCTVAAASGNAPLFIFGDEYVGGST